MKVLFIVFIQILFLLSFINCIDYYQVLELTKDATQQEIKKAFRSLSIKYHPDKNPGDEKSAKKYIEVNTAHEILSDQEKRQIYDLYGEEGLEKMGQVDFWGNQQTQRGPNAAADISVSLSELYDGVTKEFNINKNVICPLCRGTGSKDGKLKVCKFCNGKGVRMQTMSMGIGFNVQMQTTCDRCGGRGKIGGNNCPKCSGARVVPVTKTLKIEVEKGMKDGQQIVFQRESEQSPDYIPGDVIFTLRQQQHSYFKRIGDNLYTDFRINLKESILGFTKEIKHLDAHYTQVKNDAIVQPFEVKIIKAEGMPIHNYPSNKGDLHVKFIVQLPKQISQNDRELLQKIFSLKK